MAAVEVLHAFQDSIKVPQGGEKIFKDECCFSFDSPESENGLYICMKTFLGFGKDHVLRHFNKTGNSIYLHLKTIKKLKPKTEAKEDPPKKKPTRLAIGVEGGFDVEDEEEFEYEEQNSVVILPDFASIPLPNAALPEKVQSCIAGILSAQSASKNEEIEAWDGETRIISKYADNLQQLDNGKKVPPKGWKCEMCDKTENLWLNLTDGSVLCGRRYYDGTGGNNHALDQYEVTKYPLAVKLGTITPRGADIYSYDEEDMVEDPHLAKHLAHFGINMIAMEKTDKTMTELEIDLNSQLKAEWDTIQEAGKKLVPLFGAGYTGMQNLGNSCYLNSVIQVLFSTPDFINRYANGCELIFNQTPDDPSRDFNTQIAKLGAGLLSGVYSKKPSSDGDADVDKLQEGITPRMFKSLVGRGHPEFATNRQQDAQEFFLHLISLIERNSRGAQNPCDCFKYQVEERIQCVQSGQVRYKKRDDYLLALPIPMEAATNKDEVAAFQVKKKEYEEKKMVLKNDEIVRPRIPLSACLDAFSAPEIVDDFYSSALQAKSIASKITKLATFPDCLVIQLKKFTLSEDWTPKKLDISVDVTDELDLSLLRGKGLQSNEKELPEGDGPPQLEPEIDEGVVNQLVDMGFNREGCRKAVYHTNNQGSEAAMQWVFEHMADADFAVPLQIGGAKKSSQPAVNEEGVMMITGMGFTRDQAIKALNSTNNNVERAVDWIFSHADELESVAMETEAPGPQYRDGNGKYKLVAFISHMGTSTACGHYVCHILKEGRWVIYNDRKVAVSENPPKNLGYLYFYQRV
ncbi:ubiquitin carboxyl-terminal hydrolase 5-like [Saccoglossus kowalevskii]|uniref:Ubiquitin carboxyl-terminal hydrolase n=1 Tax=Saccoglossus kowalevskii TaxID=10224 RepID=A0ABM0MDB4_SACKO|nr:PREDICTED: ubiquitin carboxyl-terminal hydrolase 5-like [Saccoglossus kowalevskii]